MSSKRPASLNEPPPPKRLRGFRAARTSSTTSTKAISASTRQVFVTVEPQTEQLRGPLRAQTRVLSNEPDPPVSTIPSANTSSAQDGVPQGDEQSFSLDENPVDEEPMPSSRRTRYTKNVVSDEFNIRTRSLRPICRTALPSGSNFEPHFWMKCYATTDWAHFLVILSVQNAEKRLVSSSVGTA